MRVSRRGPRVLVKKGSARVPRTPTRARSKFFGNVGVVLSLFNMRTERRHLAYSGADGVARWHVPAGEYILCIGMSPKLRLRVAVSGRDAARFAFGGGAGGVTTRRGGPSDDVVLRGTWHFLRRGGIVAYV